MPEVSVVIPTKDEEKSIGICIEKVLAPGFTIQLVR